MTIKLLTEHHLEFLSLKGGYTGLSESFHVKMLLCWKSHATAQFFLKTISRFREQMAIVMNGEKKVNMYFTNLNLNCSENTLVEKLMKSFISYDLYIKDSIFAAKLICFVWFDFSVMLGRVFLG